MKHFLLVHRYWVLWITIGLLVVFTVADSVAEGLDNRLTFSMITAEWSARHILGAVCVGILLGILIGHLFAYQVVTISR